LTRRAIQTALDRAKGKPVLPGHLRERDIPFQEGLEDAEAVHRPSTLGLTDAIDTDH
jgi:hypothetical protein